MGIQDIIEGKKQWRAHMARVKALPPDYQIVYKEIQRYLFKIGPIDVPDGPLLSGIVDFFEEGVAVGKGVLELIGNDVAAFCDDLVRQEDLSRSPSTLQPPRRGAVGQDPLICRRGHIIQNRPVRSVRWAGIPQLSARDAPCPAAWQQCWQQSRRPGADPRPSPFQAGHIPNSLRALRA